MKFTLKEYLSIIRILNILKIVVKESHAINFLFKKIEFFCKKKKLELSFKGKKKRKIFSLDYGAYFGEKKM